MLLSQIRDELLAQHAELRTMIDTLTHMLGRWKAGEAVRDDVEGTLGLLADAFRTHNAREEELLGDVIRTIDAWGPARADIMTDEHAQEHAEMYDALVGAHRAPDAAAAEVVVRQVIERLLDHMVREEKTCLSEQVLHDDPFAADYFGG